ncbi:transposase [Streptomyces sp. NBC_01727]|nr:transposase [Streptomyces sp. NBC_01727]
MPFLKFDTEIRRFVCTANAIKSVNARIRKAVRAGGHFRNEVAALKCIHMVIMSLDTTGQGRQTDHAVEARPAGLRRRLSLGRR